MTAGERPRRGQLAVCVPWSVGMSPVRLWCVGVLHMENGGPAKPQVTESLCEGGALGVTGESVQGHQAVFCSALS